MKCETRKLTVSLLVVWLYVVFLPQWNSDGNVLIAADQMTNTSTFSLQGTIFPLTVINPITDEYILSGTWNIDVKEGRVMNFKLPISTNP